jgi:hypothetical protein
MVASLHRREAGTDSGKSADILDWFGHVEKQMEPDEVILEFERDEQIELDVDDAIAGLAALLTNDMIQGDLLPVLVRSARRARG